MREKGGEVTGQFSTTRYLISKLYIGKLYVDHVVMWVCR